MGTRLIIRCERNPSSVERMIISWECIHAAHTCSHVCVFPMDAIGPGRGLYHDYMVSAPYNEPGRIPRRYLHSAPRNHPPPPLELAQGCVLDEWSAILLSYQWPDLTLYRDDRQHNPRPVKPLIFTDCM